MLTDLSHSPACEENDLLSLLANDSDWAFQQIYHQYSPRIYQVAFHYVKCRHLAEEVVQDVFMTLWCKRKNIKTGVPVKSWLYTVAKNNTINKLKRIGCESKVINHLKYIYKDEDNSFTDKLEANDRRQLLNKACTSLSANQLTVYKLAHEQQFTYKEIAQHLHISPLTVKTHMSRALRNLKFHF